MLEHSSPPRTPHASPWESPLILRTKPTSDYLLLLVLRNLVQGLKGGSPPEASRPAIRPRICPSSIWDGKTLDDLAPSDPGAKPSSTVLFPRPPPYLCPKYLARVPGRLPSSTPWRCWSRQASPCPSPPPQLRPKQMKCPDRGQLQTPPQVLYQLFPKLQNWGPHPHLQYLNPYPNCGSQHWLSE